MIAFISSRSREHVKTGSWMLSLSQSIRPSKSTASNLRKGVLRDLGLVSPVPPAPPELNDLLYSTLSLHLAGAGQQCKQDCLWVSKPGPSPNIRSNNAVDLLALTPEESQLLQNVPWSIHNAVFDLSQRLIDKWSDFNRLSCTFTS